MEDGTKDVGDYDLRGQDVDTIFGTVRFYRGGLASVCHRAITRTAAQFDPNFPGWPLYRRLVSGDDIFDRAILAFMVGGARALSRAETKTGREYIGARTRRNDWLEQAAKDAMDHVIHGRFPAGLHERAKHFGISWETYQKIRDPLAGGVWQGVQVWRTTLIGEFTKLILRKRYHSEVAFDAL